MDGTSIVESSDDDFLNAASYDLTGIDRAASTFLYKVTGVLTLSLNFPAALQKISLKEILLKVGGAKSIKRLKADLRDSDFYTGETDSNEISQKLISAIISFYDDNYGKGSIEVKILRALLKAKPEDRLTEISKAVFPNSTKLEIRIKPFGSTLKPDVECWFFR
jgi:hypothetical protein